MTTLKGRKQIVQTADINAPAKVVWEILSDSRTLPQWVPAVDVVNACSEDGEGVGATRSCQANLAGKSGTMVERCVEYTPMTRIAYLVDEESFGMRKMFNDYGFSLNLTDLEVDRTEVTLETHYTPRNPMYRTLNAIVMRRQFRGVCKDIVGGLKTLAEVRHTAGA